MGIFQRRKPAPEPVDPGPYTITTASSAGVRDDDAELAEIVSDPWPAMVAPEPPPSPKAMWPEGEYRGRLLADGHGNLLADEGAWAGYGVFHNADGVYEFVELGGASHNQRYHARVKTIDPTREANDELDIPAAPHHNLPTEDDPHYAADGGAWHPKRGWSFTRTVSDPDEIAATVTGHTDAYGRNET